MMTAVPTSSWCRNSPTFVASGTSWIPNSWSRTGDERFDDAAQGVGTESSVGNDHGRVVFQKWRLPLLYWLLKGITFAQQTNQSTVSGAFVSILRSRWSCGPSA